MNVNRSGYYKWLLRKKQPSKRTFNVNKILQLLMKSIINILLTVIDG